MQRSSVNELHVILMLLIGSSVGFADAQSVADTGRHSQAALACQFDSGPRAGQTQELPASQQATASRVGGSCSDGAASFGTLISPSTESGVAPHGELTSICQFSNGPRAGEIVDLSRISEAGPVGVGSPCAEGASTGVAISPPTGSGLTPWSIPIPSGSVATPSTICQFMSGPKAHGWHDYAPLFSAALGSSCRDGIGSAGIVVASGHGQHY